MAALIYGIGLACLVAFALIQAGTWRAARGTGGDAWVLAGGVVAVVGPFVVLVWRLARVSAEARRQRDAP